MRNQASHFSRKARQRLYAATGALSLALWLLLTVAEGYAPLHIWLHGGAIPDNDDCAVVMLAHGKVDSGIVEVAPGAPVVWIETTPQVEFSVFSPVVDRLLSGRAPPVSAVVS